MRRRSSLPLAGKCDLKTALELAVQHHDVAFAKLPLKRGDDPEQATRSAGKQARGCGWRPAHETALQPGTYPARLPLIGPAMESQERKARQTFFCIRQIIFFP